MRRERADSPGGGGMRGLAWAGQGRAGPGEAAELRAAMRVPGALRGRAAPSPARPAPLPRRWQGRAAASPAAEAPRRTSRQIC